MMNDMGSLGWMSGGMAVIWLLVFVVLVLAVPALVKYLHSCRASAERKANCQRKDPMPAFHVSVGWRSMKAASQRNLKQPQICFISLTRSRDAAAAPTSRLDMAA